VLTLFAGTTLKGNLMGIIWTLLIGLVVGLIARAVMPGEQKLGWIMTAVLGVAGSFLASFVGKALGYSDGSPAGWITSIIGAVILLIVYGMVQKKSS
jgi:uncharacterized membrane protein YeaQ/YmgE (transglycosylase-associated protein family)